MHIRIVYHLDDGDETIESSFDNPSDSSRWLVANLAGWCLDEDVDIYIDGERQECIGR
jgi:hypothetical protein